MCWPFYTEESGVGSTIINNQYSGVMTPLRLNKKCQKFILGSNIQAWHQLNRLGNQKSKLHVFIRPCSKISKKRYFPTCHFCRTIKYRTTRKHSSRMPTTYLPPIKWTILNMSGRPEAVALFREGSQSQGSVQRRGSGSRTVGTSPPHCGQNDWPIDRHDWKHYSPATSLVGGKYEQQL